MSELKIAIKPEYHRKRVGFNGKGTVPLGMRSPSDLRDLAIIAHESKDPSLLRLFSDLPPIADLKKAKTETNLQKVVPAVVAKRGEASTARQSTGNHKRKTD